MLVKLNRSLIIGRQKYGGRLPAVVRDNPELGPVAVVIDGVDAEVVLQPRLVAAGIHPRDVAPVALRMATERCGHILNRKLRQRIGRQDDVAKLENRLHIWREQSLNHWSLVGL